MGLFDGYLLASDVDGTLLDRDVNDVMAVQNRIPPGNLQAIQRFAAQGGLFVIATGRPAEFVQQTLQYESQGPIIVANGTQIVDWPTRRVLWQKTLGEPQMAFARELTLVHGKRILGAGLFGVDGIQTNVLIEDLPQALCTTQAILKIVYVLRSPEDCDTVKEWARDNSVDAAFTRSFPVGLELHMADSGKGACLRQLRRLYPEIHTMAAVGDYENDCTMLDEADIAYAVGNALACVKQRAQVITPPNTENAVAFVIDDLARRIAASSRGK